jgi:hypothetical protein
MNTIDAMKQASKALRLVSGHVCEAAHHTKNDRHQIGEPCPVEARHSKAITDLEQAIKQAEQTKGVLK